MNFRGAEWLGVTENVLFNRLRTDGDQIFPLMVLQRAGGSNRIAHAICRASGGMFAPMPEVASLDIDQPFVSSCSHNQKVLCFISTLKRRAPNRAMKIGCPSGYAVVEPV